MDLSRMEALVGKQATRKLNNCHVAVFGLGGVGGYVVEALVRAGIKRLTLVDNDAVSPSNVNRQLYALQSVMGQLKTEVAKARVLDINPQAEVTALAVRFDATTCSQFDFNRYDYVVDAIDTVTSKLLLVELCEKNGVPVISCMGTGNKLDPTAFEVADINDTSVCPLAKVMRKELKARGISKLKVVYSKEQPKPLQQSLGESGRIPSSISFTPPVAGFVLASEVVKDLIS